MMSPSVDQRPLRSREEHLRRRLRATWATMACVVGAGVLSALLALLSRHT